MFADVEKYLSEDYRKQVGKNMKICRKASRPKITQEMMAEILHVERQHIMKIENGKVRVTVEELMAYSTLFDISPKVLLESDECSIVNYIQFKNNMDSIFSKEGTSL